jgi:transcription elongation factor Elf1
MAGATAERHLLVPCLRCLETKLILVTVSAAGSMGPAKCDECKTRELMSRISPKHPA